MKGYSGTWSRLKSPCRPPKRWFWLPEWACLIYWSSQTNHTTRNKVSTVATTDMVRNPKTTQQCQYKYWREPRTKMLTKMFCLCSWRWKRHFCSSRREEIKLGPRGSRSWSTRCCCCSYCYRYGCFCCGLAVAVTLLQQLNMIDSG